MPKNRRIQKRQTETSKRFVRLCYLAIAISLIALIISSYSLLTKGEIVYKTVYINGTGSSALPKASYAKYNITSSLITPLYYLPNDPPITTNMTFGQRLTGINTQLNSSELSIINNAPDSYFEKAGAMYLNGTFGNLVGGVTANKVPPFIVNGKPSVIYLGSITCFFCGENRWAMALALSRFGNFSALFKGYSSFGDSNFPTLYWAPGRYNQSSDDFGSFYNSKYLNFIAIDDTHPIRGGFALNPISIIEENVNATGNTAYIDSFSYILNLSRVQATAFQGTPYTIWGDYQLGGADAVDVGNSIGNNEYQLTNMTHAEVLAQLSNPNNSSFGLVEYAAADLYVAMICSSINNNAPVCSLSSIKAIESANGY